MKPEEGTLDELDYVVDNCPVIDNHAHNLLLSEELEKQPFESITTEARGSALTDTTKSLSHIRAARQLRSLYGCQDDDDWNAVLKKREEWLRVRPEELIRRCLRGTHAILMDDGLGEPSTVHPYDWHDTFTTAATRRIVRIETVAEGLMESGLRSTTTSDLGVEGYLDRMWEWFNKAFENAIIDATQDSRVAGFKSVICYRSGLEIDTHHVEGYPQPIMTPFHRYVSECIERRSYRIDAKRLNDYIVLLTVKVLSSSAEGNSLSKPIQFHTGLGDSDISLLHSNPAYLQPLIEQYPNVPFVILHSSYPYTREAGYLAMAYKNAFLDLGEVFPMLSRDGQASVLQQAFELVPYSKLLWSTDGHHFPETYWLANVQFRECLKEILHRYVRREDLSISQAIDLVKSFLFENSNVLYRLDFSLHMPEEVRHTQKALSRASHVYDIWKWESFLSRYPVDFVFMQYLDSMGTVRGRILPETEFSHLIESGGRIGISKGNMGTLQDDTVTSVCNTTGQIYMQPDLSSLRRMHAKDSLRAASVLCCWHDTDGSRIPSCPRSSLIAALEALSADHHLAPVVGFEIEVTFLRRTPSAADAYAPVSTTHAWGTLGPEDMQAMPMLGAIATALAAMGVRVQQFHSESAAGQYEFVLAPLPALAAADALVQARQAVQHVAEAHGLRATMHPQPFPGAGTGAHTHVSLPRQQQPQQQQASKEEEDDDNDDAQTHFWAGVLAHLPAICAFSMPQAASYGRVVDDCWTGGTWVVWGTQNRETPLRRVAPNQWEVRCVDGTANVYLALGAVMRAGLWGLKRKEGMAVKDCPHNPSKLTAEQREEYNIARRIPGDIDAALAALEDDADFTSAFPAGLVENYLIMKRCEQKKLADMEPEERRAWLIERY